jgi:hypothetical protein
MHEVPDAMHEAISEFTGNYFLSVKRLALSLKINNWHLVL